MVTLKSDNDKSVTSSLKVTVTGMAALVVEGAVDERMAVGFTLSNVRVNEVAAVLLLPAASCATPAAMAMVTRPCAEGVTVNV